MGEQALKITADTNLLVRVLMGDDEVQSALAKKALAEAEVVFLLLPTLCELVWVLSRGYRVPSKDVAGALLRLTRSATVVVDRPALQAGLALLEAGGDFADGVIAYLGAWGGSDVFLSFDKSAVSRLTAQGVSARLLS